MADAKLQKILGGLGEAFSDRNFRIYSVASIGSWISFFIQIVTVSWLTWELTGSTQWLAAMALLDILPNVVLMPLAGALADRFDRHKIMLLTSALLFLQSSALAIASLAGVLTIWALACLVFLHGVFIAFMVPAMYGTVPRFVARSKLASAIAVSSAYAQLAVFVGPALAGWIVAAYGSATAFVTNAAGYVLLIGAFLSLKTPTDYKHPQISSRSVWGDIADGLRYLGEQAALVPMLVVLLVADALTAGFFHMLPAFVDNVLDAGVVGMSIILAARGIGATASALTIAHAKERFISPRIALWAFLAGLIALVTIAQSGDIVIAAAFACFLGVSNEVRKTVTVASIQLTITEEQRGRVMGTIFMISQLAAGIGTYAIGTLAGHFSLSTIMSFGVGFGIAVWLAFYIKRKTLFPTR